MLLAISAQAKLMQQIAPLVEQPAAVIYQAAILSRVSGTFQVFRSSSYVQTCTDAQNFMISESSWLSFGTTSPCAFMNGGYPQALGVGPVFVCPANYTLRGGGSTCIPDQLCPLDPANPWTYSASANMCERPAACPAHASGNPCTCDTGYQFDATQTNCIQEQFSLTLTPTSATIEPGKRYTFTATVTKQDGSAPGKDVPVNISLKVDAKSGGHEHGDSTRPRGSIDNTQCASDATCKTFTIPAGSTTATFNFNSTDASGTHTVTASCDKCTNGAQEGKVDVKVDGLLPIPGSQSYSLTEPINGGGTKIVGATKQHASNHFLTPAAADVLWRIAAAYYFEPRFMVFDKTLNKRVSPPLLYLNDASLEWGGKFDITGSWGGEHAEHKRGSVIDIRANPSGYGTMPLANFSEFKKLARGTSVDAIGTTVDAGIHCTRDKKSTPKSQRHNRIEPNCISQLDGSPDDNRHYHIRLMGVSE
jgi:hypothetical protein